MKKIVVSLCVLVTLGLQANDIASDMKTMRDGLQEMQDGFLYNNSKSVVSGIDKIEKVNGSLHSKESIESFLPQEKKKLVGVTLLSAKSLNSDLEAMREYIKQNKMLEAAALHSDVMKDCTRCHAIVRGW
ncbi:MAG: hypothetical protein Q7S59_07925 [Sulfurimonas sp.]|nr:hypothetical protein [Sulfurimonas sp.]